MNNNFYLKRMALYARKHYVENSRSYLFGFLGLIALTLFTLYMIRGEAPVSLLLVISWIYFTQISSQCHYALRSIEQSYTLPATSTEKYLFIWLNSAIIIPLITTAIVLALSTIFSVALNKTVGLSLSGIDLQVATLALLYQAGALFCCSWMKGSPLKAYIITIVILLGIFMVYGVIYQKLTPYLQYSIDITDGSCYSYIDTARIGYPLANNISNLFTTGGAMGFWVIVFWVVGYFKFKERTLK